MKTINKIAKVVLIFIFIQLFMASTYALTNCFNNPGFTIANAASGNEYIVTLVSNTFTDQNIILTFNPNNINNSDCVNKTFVLLIDIDEQFQLTGSNKYMEISGDLNILRIKDSNPNAVIDINFFVNNDETLPALYNNAGPGELNIKIPKIEVITPLQIIANEGERVFIDTSENSNQRSGYGVRIKLKELEIQQDIDANISLIATNPNNRSSCVNSNSHPGMHGGISELIIDNINNYGNLGINLVAANGSDGTNGCKTADEIGGHGGNGGYAGLSLEDITNYSIYNLNIYSGNGGNGGQGSDEGNCGGSPQQGGDAGFAGDLNFSINNIDNFDINSESNINLIGGKGGNGGRAGKDRCQTDTKKTGGSAGVGGDIILDNSNLQINNGDYNITILAGAGGKGGNGSFYRSRPRGAFGLSADGGNVYNGNISRIVNNNLYSYYAKSGKININDYALNHNIVDRTRSTAVAGDISNLNIDYLANHYYLDIITELNETNVDYLNSANCNCEEDCQTIGADPIMGNININYLASGSFLPRTAKIIKIPIADSLTKIDIFGCYMKSIGNSQLNYEADVLQIEGTNLADIANDFNEAGSKIGLVNPVNKYCPVCDSLELDNPSLRTDTIYTIYTDTSSGNIVDLNIYYVNSDGNLFKPPGYLSDQDYIVYSLAPGKTIIPITSTQFPNSEIKEYKISKDKLYYNPEALPLENLEDAQNTHGFGIDNVRLFCPGQRYLLKFRFNGDTTINEMYFTPLFDIK